jgi:hypothetical protein
MHATARLTHLLDLANKGPALRAALAEEVAELLTNWPSDCPVEMRGACEALLARASREVDDNVLARLRVCLYADPALAARVLPRPGIGRDLVEIARDGGDIAASLAQALNLPHARAGEILSDPSGLALAIACKSLRLSRAAFSTLTMLLGHKDDIAQTYARLDVYDAMGAWEAARQLQGWRTSDAVAHAA